MRGWRAQWFGVRAALALAAMLMQAAIPLLIAAEIDAASNATPICSAATAGDHKSGPQKPSHTCPICAAMAASAAVTATAPPALPLPRVVVTRIVASLPQDAAELVFAAAYRSRAPPQA